MEFMARMRRLWQYDGFRKLLVVRIAAQVADGVTQMGMVSYALFSPERQTNAWAVVGVLAITLLPFSIVGPFTGVLLDRWPRQRMVMVTESIRLSVCVAIAAVIFFAPATSTSGIVATYALVLVVLSFNRFLLAGLGAGLADVVPQKAYLDASSVMPMLGPIGLVSGGIVAGIVRLVVANASHADAIIFCAAAVCCCATVVLNSRIGRLELGPLTHDADDAPSDDAPSDDAVKTGTYERPHNGGPRQILRGLVEGYAHLRTQKPVTQGLWAISVQHAMYGVLMTCVIMAYRNYFASPTNPDAAIVPMGIWFGASGVGFALSGVVGPMLGHRLGIRRAVLACMIVSAIAQVVPGSIFYRPTLVIAAFVMGVCLQTIKVYVDALVQIYITDAFRGRVFALYDMLNNVTLVVGALIAALVAPKQGLWLPLFLGVAVVLAAHWAIFLAISRPWGDDPRAAGSALTGGKKKTAVSPR
jgi:MFS family permease